MAGVKDYRSQSDQLEDFAGEITEDQRQACRRIICANARGDTQAEQLADAELLMEALGVHPRQNGHELPSVAIHDLVGSTTFMVPHTPPRRLQ